MFIKRKTNAQKTNNLQKNIERYTAHTISEMVAYKIYAICLNLSV